MYNNSFHLLIGMMGLLCISSILAMILDKHKMKSNTLVQVVQIFAALTGLSASSLHLLLRPGQTETLPLMDYGEGVQVLLRFDGLSAFFLLLLSLILLCTSMYAIGYNKIYHGKKSIRLLNVLNGFFILSMMGVFISGDLISFFVSWEIMALASYFLVSFEHEQKANREAALRYAIMMHIGAAVLMVALILMYTITGHTDFESLRAMRFLPHTLAPGMKDLIAVLLFTAFGLKAGIIPLHIWKPGAYPAASSPVGATMATIMMNTAVYGMVRFISETLAVRSEVIGIVIFCLSLLTLIVGVSYAYIENDIKRMLAYSGIDNAGIIMGAIGLSIMAKSSGNDMLMVMALTAALLHTFNHTLFKSLLFLNAGSIRLITGSGNMEEMGGIIRFMPWTAFFTLIGALSISAFLPFNGFAGEWMLYQALLSGIAKGHTVASVLQMLGIATLGISGVMVAGCFVKFLGIAFLGRPRQPELMKRRVEKEVPLVMLLPKALLSVLCLAAGVFPLFLIRQIQTLLGGAGIADRVGDLGSKAQYFMNAGKGVMMTMPGTLLILIALIPAALMLVLMLVGGKVRRRTYTTWDCGYPQLSERMQYTATGFAKPISIVFKGLYQPTRDLKVERDKFAYQNNHMYYLVKTERVFEKYLYSPVVSALIRSSQYVKIRVQSGSVHLYLVYILLTLIGFLIYNKMV